MHTKICWKLSSYDLFKDDFNKDLDFYVRVRAYKKRASGKQP